MPIKVSSQEDTNFEEIAWLCDGEWELPRQIETLEQWLLENRGNLQKGSYVADIGYIQREGAFGGGAIIRLVAMEAMLALGMELHLSEYPD